jgi:hypothetical protein
MNDWLHNLPVMWMAVVLFSATYIATAGIFAAVIVLARGERALAFKAVSPGMLPPLGILFALFVAFTASQVWSNNDSANAAVSREASALRATLVLATRFPGEPGVHLRSQIRRYVEEAAADEWPTMAGGRATLAAGSHHLAGALESILAVTPSDLGQQTAQAGIVADLESALDARRQRILISRSQVSLAKWSCIVIQAVCMLLAIAMVHSDKRLTAAIAMGLFATGVAVSLLLIAAYDGPFGGELAVGPEPILQVLSETGHS